MHITENAAFEKRVMIFPASYKEHYDMRWIKARKKKTEILYIFFVIHTANVVHLAERLAEQQKTKAA